MYHKNRKNCGHMGPPGTIGEIRMKKLLLASTRYMSEFFTVNAGDAARSGLNEESADSGIKDIGVSGDLTYGFTESWSVTGLAAYTRLLGDAEDSPVVDDRGDENQLFAGVLVNFRW